MNESEYSQKAIEAVRRDQPNAENFWAPYVFKDDFYGGTLVIVRFTAQGHEVQNNVFIDKDGVPAVFYRTEDLAKALASRKPLSFISRFFYAGGVPGTIAILITVTLCYLVLFVPSSPVPDVFSNALTLILGWYFGSKVKTES